MSSVIYNAAPEAARVTLVHRNPDGSHYQYDLGLRIIGWDCEIRNDPLTHYTYGGEEVRQHVETTVRLTMTGRMPAPGEPPVEESDAMRLARAVLGGDAQAALLLADEVQACHLASSAGRAFTPRDRLEAEVELLRTALRPLADQAAQVDGFPRGTRLCDVGPANCTLTTSHAEDASHALALLEHPR